MKDFLDKLSSYNLFNYLLPGTIFVVAADNLTSYSFIQQNIVLGLFLYYFIGLVISRIGSLIVEPILKKLKFVEFSEYKDFVAASKADEKLDILSEANNMYRTFTAAFLLLLIFIGYERTVTAVPVIGQYRAITLILILLTMFLFSYKKQTAFIKQRIKTKLKKG